MTSKTEGLYPRVAPTLLQREYSVRLPRGSVVGRGTAPTPRLTAVSSLLVVANRSLFFLSSQTFVRLQTFTYTHLFLHAACIAHVQNSHFSRHPAASVAAPWTEQLSPRLSVVTELPQPRARRARRARRVRRVRRVRRAQPKPQSQP